MRRARHARDPGPLVRVGVLLAALAVVGGVTVAVTAVSTAPPATLPASASIRAAATPDPDPTVVPPVTDGGAQLAVPDAVTPGEVPVAVRIPAIGVSSRLVRLGTAADGTMEVPTDFSRAGWFADGPVPGDPGPAVIAGHVDGTQGPAVFYRLGALRPGDEVEVVRRDGAVVRFTVRRIERVPKHAFPTDEVYGPVPGPALRLITCGGTVDPRTGHYRDNVVVFAS